MNDIVMNIYSDGNILMMACKIVVYIFALESLSYLVSIVMGVARTACSK